jgi:hypothetical protein
MSSLDAIGLAASQGEVLSASAYRADFRERDRTSDARDSWKLERRQHFREPGRASWEAFARGEWDEALRLNEERRASIKEFTDASLARGAGLYRVRVVEEPVSPYLQWESHLLRLRAECGERIRVVHGSAVTTLEREGPLPELINLGSATLYEIRYDDDGVLVGGVRYTDHGLVTRFVDLCEYLFAAGEDIQEYVERAVVPLPPPSGLE